LGLKAVVKPLDVVIFCVCVCVWERESLFEFCVSVFVVRTALVWICTLQHEFDCAYYTNKYALLL